MNRKIFFYIVLLGFFNSSLFGMKSAPLELWSPNLAGSEQYRLGAVTMTIANPGEAVSEEEQGKLYFTDGETQEISLLVGKDHRKLGIFRSTNSLKTLNCAAMIAEQEKEKVICITVTSDSICGVKPYPGFDCVLNEKKYYVKVTHKELTLLDGLSVQSKNNSAFVAIKALLNDAGGWMQSHQVVVAGCLFAFGAVAAYYFGLFVKKI